MAMTTIANIKKIGEECSKLCDESEQIYTNLVENTNMKVVQDKLI